MNINEVTKPNMDNFRLAGICICWIYLLCPLQRSELSFPTEQDAFIVRLLRMVTRDGFYLYLCKIFRHCTGCLEKGIDIFEVILLENAFPGRNSTKFIGTEDSC